MGSPKELGSGVVLGLETDDEGVGPGSSASSDDVSDLSCHLAEA